MKEIRRFIYNSTTWIWNNPSPTRDIVVEMDNWRFYKELTKNKYVSYDDHTCDLLRKWIWIEEITEDTHIPQYYDTGHLTINIWKNIY